MIADLASGFACLKSRPRPTASFQMQAGEFGKRVSGETRKRVAHQGLAREARDNRTEQKTETGRYSSSEPSRKASFGVPLSALEKRSPEQSRTTSKRVYHRWLLASCPRTKGTHTVGHVMTRRHYPRLLRRMARSSTIKQPVRWALETCARYGNESRVCGHPFKP